MFVLEKGMIFRLCPKAVFKFLLLSTVVLAIANLAGIVIRLFPGHSVFNDLIQLFDFNSERNIPTLYSSINLLFGALLLTCIAIKSKTMGSSWLPWLGLASVLGFLSIDETASFHEQLAEPVQQLLNVSGLFYYVWVIPYLLAVGILFLLYFRFLMQLPQKTRSLFIFSGVVFVLGAVGFEAVGNLLVQVYGSDSTLYYRLAYTCEEFSEMLSVIVFIYALFDYMVSRFGVFEVAVENPTVHYASRGKRELYEVPLERTNLRDLHNLHIRGDRRR